MQVWSGLRVQAGASPERKSIGELLEEERLQDEEAEGALEEGAGGGGSVHCRRVPLGAETNVKWLTWSCKVRLAR